MSKALRGRSFWTFGAAKSSSKKPKADQGPRCGLCGATNGLTRTECCGNWICDDEDEYVLFSYAHNCCHRNHRRYTVCGHHHEEGHDGPWKDCEDCRRGTETEMFVYFATNEYNFEILENPPSYEPTRCDECQRVIRLGHDGYARMSNGYYCTSCSDKRLNRTQRGKTLGR